MGGKTATTTPQLPSELSGLYSGAADYLGGSMPEGGSFLGPEGWYQDYSGAYPAGGGGTGFNWKFPQGGGGDDPFGYTPIFPGGGMEPVQPGGWSNQGTPAGQPTSSGGIQAEQSGGGLTLVPQTATQTQDAQTAGPNTMQPISRSNAIQWAPGATSQVAMRQPGQVASAGLQPPDGGPGPGPPPPGDDGGDDGGDGDSGSSGGGGTWGGIGFDNPHQQTGARSEWIPEGSNLPMTGGQYGFWAPNARRVAGPSGLMDWAARGVEGTFGQTEGEGAAFDALGRAQAAADARVQGAGLQNPLEHPAIAAGRQAFEETILPDIETRASSMGLGRSLNLGDTTAKMESQYLLPLIQGELAREERGIERGMQGNLAAAGQYAGLGNQATNRMLSSLGTGMQFGQIGRGIAQEGNEAQYEDFLRRQALNELPVRLAFGQAPNMIGQKSSQGGLFK